MRPIDVRAHRRWSPSKTKVHRQWKNPNKRVFKIEPRGRSLELIARLIVAIKANKSKKIESFIGRTEAINRWALRIGQSCTWSDSNWVNTLTGLSVDSEWPYTEWAYSEWTHWIDGQLAICNWSLLVCDKVFTCPSSLSTAFRVASLARILNLKFLISKFLIFPNWSSSRL